MSQQLAFVITDGSGRIGSSERQLIRRHCMRQKNKQPGSRRSRREAARAAARISPESRSEVQGVTHLSDGLVSRDRVVPSSRSDQKTLLIKQCILPSPPDWALFPFPEGLDHSTQKLMHEYFVHNPIRDSLYPFKHFGIHIDFDEDPFMCFRLLCSEKLCFRAILLLTSASNDLVLQRPLSGTTYRHLRRVLPLLNHRLSDKDAYKNDITLYVVSILASIAVLFGDYNAARAHAVGLSEILRLRGNSRAVNDNPVIQFSMDRLNFSSSVVTELWTPIYHRSAWESPDFSTEVINVHHSQDMLCIDGLVNTDLAVVFRYIQYTAILFNTHYHSKTPINGAFIRQCLGFVHSSLIDLEGRLKGELSKCVHIGMMIFLATTFRLPGWSEQHYCQGLAEKMPVAYAAARPLIPAQRGTLDIWLMLMAQICTGPVAEKCWDLSKICRLDWDETRRRLKQVMWIDAFHDDIGKRAFETLASSRQVRKSY
ncbi:hypothetical protein CDV36_005249 [Fusarium kuroshium]|uniref:Transcription factor domain-containing protein n=1 Tax=Fusarium kuroshium TaxID=2010991 RepID=A0A3M2SD02_9HYPO|nr:hypothetical protein CDV36_005249 [Fusarium kuroshium]